MRNPKVAKQAQKVVNLQADASTIKPKNFVENFANLRLKIAQAAKNAVAVILKNQANKRYYYGELDNLPNTIIATVDNSGTATACIGRLEQFIKADGFQQEGLDDVKVNARQTMAALLDEVTTNVAYLEGLAIRLVFNNIGQVSKMYNIDVKTLRKVRDGFEYNPLNGEIGKSENETLFYPEFNPERTPEERRGIIAKQVQEHGEQLGEIFYVFRKGLGRYYDIYPVPRYYASIEDLVSDGKISRLDLRNLSQGFRTPVIISTGPIDDQNKDEEGYTPQDYFDAALEEFTGENASPILHLKGNTEEFKPTVTTINVAEILDQTDRASDRIAKRVARVMEVPDVLVGIAKEGQLGNVQEVKNQMALFALTVYKKQDLIKQSFDLLKPFYGIPGLDQNTDFTLTTLKPFDFIPDAVIANLTPEEQKELFQINLTASQPTSPAGVPAQAAERNDALTNLTGKQLQNIQRIVRKFNKEELTYDQAALMLSQGFGFTEEQVGAWLVTKEEEEIA